MHYMLKLHEILTMNNIETDVSKKKNENWQAYYILDEILIAGELQESSKRIVIKLISTHVCFFLIVNLSFIIYTLVLLIDYLH